MSAPTWTPDHPLIGRLLEKRFQIASYIREGGMAQVFCAVQNQEPRHVAVKVLHPDLAGDREIVARFMREAHTASRLEHPNIVRIVGFGTDKELLFMAMELIFGDDLSARVKLKGSFSHERAVEIMIDVCNALQHAHERGVIHRDIKPENVMIARQPDAPMKEVVKVLDFGIAKILDARPDVELADEAPTDVRSVLTRVGTWVGTPAYMSPEQGSARPVDHRSDIYSAGVLLFELLCGRPPFEGETPLQILARHIHDPIPRPSQLVPLNPKLEAAIVRALAKDPAERFESASAFAAALAEVLPELSPESSQRWTGAQQRSYGTSPTMSLPEQPRGAQRLPTGPMPPAETDDDPDDQRTSALPTFPQKNAPANARTSESGAISPRKTLHPLVGRMLRERYHVASFIREGSMAQVFCGLQDDEPRHVAIKVVHPNLAGDRDVVARFIREGQVAARLSHPNVVRVLEVGEDEGLLFMVMELLFGDDLSARIKQKGSFSQARAVQIAADVCAALEHAHERGIVHRDVKPENVMLCRQPESPERELVKVLDFGMAKVLDERDPGGSGAAPGMRSQLTRVGTLVGTPTYMSPEQASATKIDHRSDIYSVGVLLYELVCGRPPFVGETALQIAARHVREPPPRPSTLAQMPVALESILVRMLAKDPAARPQSARELGAALSAIANDLSRTTGSGASSDRKVRLTGRIQLPPEIMAARASSPVVRAAEASAARAAQAQLPPTASPSAADDAVPLSVRATLPASAMAGASVQAAVAYAQQQRASSAALAPGGGAMPPVPHEPSPESQSAPGRGSALRRTARLDPNFVPQPAFGGPASSRSSAAALATPAGEPRDVTSLKDPRVDRLVKLVAALAILLLIALILIVALAFGR